MHISFNTEELTALDSHIIRVLADALSQVPAAPQPEVGDNTGSTATVSSSAEGGGVSGEAASTITASPAPVNQNAGVDKPKEEPVVELANPTTLPPEGQVFTQSSTEVTAPAPGPANPPTVTLTLDDVRAKLQAFTAVKGIEAGIELLQKFEAGRISELKPAKYAEFTAACEVVA